MPSGNFTNALATHYPSVEEFEALLREEPLGHVLHQQILTGTPYAFRGDPAQDSLLRSHIGDALAVPPARVRVVGSGRIGFSLNPDNFPRRFSEESDLDVLVVDKALFDLAWMTMLKWNYPRRNSMSTVDLNWRGTRRTELYWGWFVPDSFRYVGLSFPQDLIPLRDLSAKWFEAFQSLGQLREFAGRSVSGRLYRTWGYALLYHAEGLRQLKVIAEREA